MIGALLLGLVALVLLVANGQPATTDASPSDTHGNAGSRLLRPLSLADVLPPGDEPIGRLEGRGPASVEPKRHPGRPQPLQLREAGDDLDTQSGGLMQR